MKDRMTFGKVLHLLANTALIVIVVLLLMELGSQFKAAKYENSIDNPDNAPFVVEVAFNLGITPEEVTQEQFNDRYLKE